MNRRNGSPLWSAIKSFLYEPQPKGVGWQNIFGSSLVWLFFIQVITGLLLAIYYSPTPETALASIRYIEEQVAFGGFLRGVHHWAASAFVILLGLHLLRTFLSGAYKKPRHWTWIAGVILMTLVLGMAFTGYLLPWDMKGYFATKVGIEVGALVPVVGDLVKKLLQGGTEMGIKTLNRFYIWHILWIPIGIALIMGIHVYLVVTRGITPPGKRMDESPETTDPFFPNQAWKDFTGMAVVTLALIGMSILFGASVGEPVDPNTTTFVPRPEWYFFPLYQLLKIFEGQLEIIGGVVLPGLLIIGMLLLPFLDRNKERRLKHRPLATGLGIIVPVSVVALTIWGWQSGQSLESQFARESAESDWYTVARSPNEDLVDAGLYEAYLPMRCGTCHDQDPKGTNIPPSLYGAGDRYQRTWLEEYMLEPHDRRYEEKGVRPTIRMPDYRLTRAESERLAAFLSQETGEDSLVPNEVDWTVRDTAMITKGKQLYGEYQCGSCHVIDGEGGEIGPALDGVGDRLKPDWMYTFIGDARRLIPDTPMKNYDLWKEEREALTYYLLSLRDSGE
ncbi:MAG: cytochrome b N-terminal domain-containing protein [Candidatus Marinimicrobia bacterium]|nr:cytochrome b N-terminal domain-containing protein [Candidatus Neomarinimicrobiota bacterium]MCF7827656.1 cytochrome b N-terminal domain-containing protein [Candidatus Neomarinimicrobiota bacterium]MCF7881289.1 cytochrome b N-terminal domain-containing protein [Candidatus Neomarinimicrobiota bacterium]